MALADLFADPAETVAGVDVGGPGKGFHYAVLRGRDLVASGRAMTADEVAEAVVEHAPSVVAVDSPRVLAPDGLAGRACEREFIDATICGIRLTPDRATMAARGHENHLSWILQGLDLYRRLDEGPWETIECFPTASWSVWGGARGAASRARWSARVLEGTGLTALPTRMNQDARDAVGAALTGLAYARARHRSFGDLVIPA
jgi:predicted nuclease with RNAse H fold